MNTNQKTMLVSLNTKKQSSTKIPVKNEKLGSCSGCCGSCSGK